LPDQFTLGNSWGPGWIRSAGNGTAPGLVGPTATQAASLLSYALLNGRGLAVTLLTNGCSTRDLYEDLYRESSPSSADVEHASAALPARRNPVNATFTAHPEIYERASARLEVLVGSGTARFLRR